MKHPLFISFMIFSQFALAQSVDYNKIILPSNLANLEFEEKLVQLAWKNHPSNQLLYNNLQIAKHDTKIASSEWLNTIRITGNLNEFTIDQSGDPADNRAQFFPRYNFGLQIPLGIFSGTSNQVKKGRQLEQVAQHTLDAQKLAVRSQVLTTYNTYLMYREIFNLRSQELEEATASFVLLEQRFKSGEEKYDRYSAGLSTLNKVKIDRVMAQTDYSNSKLALEELIGLKLEDVK
jgi:outer membrane protein TolC